MPAQRVVYFSSHDPRLRSNLANRASKELAGPRGPLANCANHVIRSVISSFSGADSTAVGRLPTGLAGDGDARDALAWIKPSAADSKRLSEDFLGRAATAAYGIPPFSRYQKIVILGAVPHKNQPFSPRA